MPAKKRQVDNCERSKESYAEVCSLKDTDSITLLTKKVFMIANSFVLTASRMRPINYIFDAHTKPNLLREDLVERDWLPSICLCYSPRLKRATNQNVEVVGAIVLRVRIEDSAIGVMFRVVGNLAVPVLLGTSFIDKIIKNIFPDERKTVLFNYSSVSTLTVHQTETDRPGEQEDDTVAYVMV